MQFESAKLPPAAVRRAAEGWGGDLYAVIENTGGRTAVVWYTTWDSEQDASEFCEAYTLALEKKYGRTLEGPPAAGPTRFDSGAGQVYCERRARDVLVLDGVDEDMLKHTEAIWNGTSKKVTTSFERVPHKAEPPLPERPDKKKAREYSVRNKGFP